ncbi:response regulator transcription factor [Flaviaesturariibacter amylovorans]|uniref:Response regulator transcription factor n=1 Tax=Flaviaesturariibacter amylovorans TaxID=1084520 RepID=A0ABP8H606_9BACT
MFENETIRVVIADDHVLFREGLRLLLQRLKLLDIEVVLEANNGLEVLDFLEKATADIVLMDVQMPVMDGIEATALLNQRYPAISVIALSSFGESISVAEMIEAGARGYLLKNTSKEELAHAISQVLAGELFIAPGLEVDIPATPRSHVSGFPPHLTAREQEILQLICEGKTSKEIARVLWISKRTVDGHRERIMQKTGSRNLAEILRYAWRRQLFCM